MVILRVVCTRAKVFGVSLSLCLSLCFFLFPLLLFLFLFLFILFLILIIILILLIIIILIIIFSCFSEPDLSVLCSYMHVLSFWPPTDPETMRTKKELIKKLS